MSSEANSHDLPLVEGNESSTYQRSAVVSIDELPMGAKIVNFSTTEEIDRLVNTTRDLGMNGDFDRFKGRNLTGSLEGAINLPGKFIDKHLKKARFNGKVTEITITKLPFDASLIEKSLTSRVSISPNFSLLTELSLSSTGRGIIGKLFVQTAYGIAFNNQNFFYLYRHRVLKGEKGATVLDSLMADSTLNWTTAQQMALRNVVSGGLPGLGRRR